MVIRIRKLPDGPLTELEQLFQTSPNVEPNRCAPSQCWWKTNDVRSQSKAQTDYYKRQCEVAEQSRRASDTSSFPDN
jgi:hypothetical protein